MTTAGRIDVDALRRSTLPGRLVERARTRPAQVAFRAKRLGVYRETTWAELAERVAAVALGMARDHGLARGETVAIVGDPCPEWTIADLAAQSLGAITYGIYPTSAPGEVRYLLQHGGAALVVCEDQEHLDKTLGVLDECPSVRGVTLIDTRAYFMARDARVRPFADIEASGRAAGATVDTLARSVSDVAPGDPATIVYTSGTTASPKGALYRHGAHLAACANILLHYPVLAAHPHRVVAMLPLCHTMGRNTAITMPLIADVVPHYPESVETAAETLFEVAPTFLFTVPRYLQKFAAHLLVGIDSSSTVKRAAYRAAMALARRRLAARRAGRLRPWHALGQALAWGLVLRWLTEKVGLARLELLLSSGAALPPAVASLWQAWGLDICEAYGQTETGGGLISGQRSGFPDAGDVGVAAPGTDVRLGEDGEVLVSARDLFAGYWRDEAATRSVVVDGWLRTGDVGEWVAAPAGAMSMRSNVRRHAAAQDARAGEHALRLVDRKKDLLITAGGKNVSPTQVETRLRASPYVSEAIVFGEGRKYLSALVELDQETVAEWARARGVLHAGYGTLVAHPDVVALIHTEIERANADLARVEQVKAFRILPRELDPEQEGEPVTPTRKVKRRLMLERYRDLVDEMYTAGEERRIDQEVAGLA